MNRANGGEAAVGLREAWGVEPALLARAPGRVNLIGEHVDYNGGFVLPAAIDRAVIVAAAPRTDGLFRVLAVDRGETDGFSVEQLRAGPVSATSGRTRWTRYVRGVAGVLLEEGIPLRGADLAIHGEVPEAVGLSSSAALEVAVATALLGVAGATIAPERLAVLCQRAEVEWAGVACGIMDQFVSVLARAHHALFLDCRSLAYEHVPIPRGVRLIATDSGVRRGLQESAYNERVAECRAAAALLGVAELRDVSLADFAAREEVLPEPARRRARHVVHEIERTRQAAEALRRGDVSRVGDLMTEAHASLRDDYEVSTPELDALVAAALRVSGVYGSRISGAGFGGCTISLVAESAV